MMILRSSQASPFGRKVRIAISLLGFDGDVKVEPADTSDINDSVRRQNPLGKIPVLIDEDGTAFYDSRVILEYLEGYVIHEWPSGSQLTFTPSFEQPRGQYHGEDTPPP